ncbi:MAG: class I SAM-dependent methyltransferase [Bacteroidales bacterium]|nr:class I SAM-dependent methyltransferase [Bacteroidales bacterium]
MDSIKEIHNKKISDSYFSFYNKEIVNLLPENPGVILDIGCATGTLGARIIEQKKPIQYDGIEIVQHIAYEAKKYLNKVYVGEAEEWLPKLPSKSYNWIILADSLEHTVNPWNVLAEVYRILDDKGKVLISIPNVRNLGVITDLLVKGIWKYRDFGIMDQGHLRFFTKKSIVEMLEQSGFSVKTLYSDPRNRWKKFPGRFFSRIISLAIFQPKAYEELITVQWVIKAEKI